MITVGTALVGAVLFVGGLMLIAAVFVMVSLAALSRSSSMAQYTLSLPGRGSTTWSSGGLDHSSVIDATARASAPAIRLDPARRAVE